MSRVLPQARAFHHAPDLPHEVWSALSQNEAVANIILSSAKKALTEHNNDQLWIALFDESNNVLFVLSCTKGPLGNYPIFIVSCRCPVVPAQTEVIDIADAMSALVLCLLQEVPPQRVFSVFSTANVAKAFARAFVAQVPEEHGIRAIDKPYYEAVLSSCTKETIVERPNLKFPLQNGEDIVVNLRLADMSDLKGVQDLCQEFSRSSPPYELDDARANLEARSMIENGQVWVHTVEQAGQEDVACLVATTRKSDNVTAVTKVITAPKWRGRRCALRLLHRVCHHIFSNQKMKKRVVLYVGTSDALAGARHVYVQVGFQGLEEEHIQQMNDEEKWLEIGFKSTTLGYW